MRPRGGGPSYYGWTDDNGTGIITPAARPWPVRSWRRPTRLLIAPAMTVDLVPSMPKRNTNLHAEQTDYERTIAAAIGARIRARRKALELTQEDVRARMAVALVATTRTQYSRIENGESLPNAAEIIALASVLGVPYGWLLDEEGDLGTGG